MFRLCQILFIILCAAVPLNTALGQDGEELRLAVNGLPPSQFNPYRNTGLPYVYTWSAVFDGLTVIDAQGDVQPALATARGPALGRGVGALRVEELRDAGVGR